ncbi:MAG: hypothetical protein R8M46_06845 [Ghiorsea sp.]
MSHQQQLIDVSKAANKEELVPLLVKLRLRSDFEANAKGITEDIVQGFSDDEVAALPESAIVHITDAYFIMSRRGVSDHDIFEKIEMQRSLLGRDVDIPQGITLTKYIKLHLKKEFPHIATLNDKIVNMEILYVATWFSQTTKKKLSWAEANAYASKVFSSLQAEYVNSQTVPEDRVIEVVTGIDETVIESSSVRQWLLVLIVIGLFAAGAYWLMFMDGLILLNQFIEKQVK